MDGRTLAALIGRPDGSKYQRYVSGICSMATWVTLAVFANEKILCRPGRHRDLACFRLDCSSGQPVIEEGVDRLAQRQRQAVLLGRLHHDQALRSAGELVQSLCFGER